MQKGSFLHIFNKCWTFNIDEFQILFDELILPADQWWFRQFWRLIKNSNLSWVIIKFIFQKKYKFYDQTLLLSTLLIKKN